MCGGFIYIISKLTDSLGIIETIQSDIETIKNKLNYFAYRVTYEGESAVMYYTGGTIYYSVLKYSIKSNVFDKFISLIKLFDTSK